MKQIYTKTGDGGETSLRGGARVPKDDLRIETNGQLDMLNALLGMVTNDERLTAADRELLTTVQRELMVVMSHVATPEGAANPRPLHCTELTQEMERMIDNTAERPLGFVIPRGIIHVARAQARTAERRLWSLHREHPLKASILRLINRLSDYLFVLALKIEKDNDETDKN